MSDFRINVLGCGSAKPSLKHNPSSTVVDFRGNLFMIDCGEGAQQQMMRMHLKMSRLNHIFITHLHGDHVFGLPGLLGTLALTRKGGGVTIHTSPKGKSVLTTVLDYFAKDTDLQIEYVVTDPVVESITFENDSLRVRTIPLDHREQAMGFVFEEKPKLRHIRRDMIDYHHIPFSQINAIKNGGDFVNEKGVVIPNSTLTTAADKSYSYAHISDTRYMPGLAKKIEGVDLLFHETTYLRGDAADARLRFHSTAEQAATVARAAGVGWLLTGHYSSRYRDDSLFQSEAQEIFPNTILGNEGLCLDLPELARKV